MLIISESDHITAHQRTDNEDERWNIQLSEYPDGEYENPYGRKTIQVPVMWEIL